MPCDYSPYTLPTVDFVGGETQDFEFSAYFHTGHRPFPVDGCTASFSVVSFVNKMGTPILTKSMTIRGDNILAVTLQPADTVNLYGKYIYQISIRDANGTVEIPNQGILFISNNIHKKFITQ